VAFCVCGGASELVGWFRSASFKVSFCLLQSVCVENNYIG